MRKPLWTLEQIDLSPLGPSTFPARRTMGTNKNRC